MKKLNNRGISLIEIIISLALAAVLAVAVSAVVISAHKVKHINHQKLECIALSKSIIDEISSEKPIWITKENLESWLLAKNYTKESNGLFRKTSLDSKNIRYTVYVEIIDTDIENLLT